MSLPLLKNNDQRKAFIENYREWPVWLEVPETQETYYRYDFPDGSSIVVKEYKRWKEWFANNKYYSDKTPDSFDNTYYLLKPGYHYFHDCQSNATALIEHLKEMQKGEK